jgi:hypothetical protein
MYSIGVPALNDYTAWSVLRIGPFGFTGGPRPARNTQIGSPKSGGEPKSSVLRALMLAGLWPIIVFEENTSYSP